MSPLLRRPTGARGRIHRITPEDAGWTYVGFDLWRLGPGEAAEGVTGEREAILVLVEGKARLAADGRDFGEMGDRASPFDFRPPHALYVPRDADWRAEATSDCVLAVCTAPAARRREARALGPEGIDRLERGKGANTRYIHPIAMEERDVAESLLVTEVLTPPGHWSSYPPHRHDEDDFPRITHLEETYHHRLDPPTGFAFQRVFTEDGSLDETMSVADGDVTLVPKGHHPCGAPHGVEMYYLNVMAGPRRAWRFVNHPDFDWIARRDAG